MNNCPYCKSKLSRKNVKTIRLDGLKWYQYSSEPSFKNVCSLCNRDIVKEYINRWYYQVGGLLVLFSLTYSIFFYEYKEGFSFFKAFLILIATAGGLIGIKQSTDYKYVSVQTQKNKNIKELKKGAYRHLKNPVLAHDYMQKHQLTYSDVKALINSGEIAAWGGADEYSVFVDET